VLVRGDAAGLLDTSARWGPCARIGISGSGMKARVQRGRAQLKALLLDCCSVELDPRGGIAEYHARRGSCGGCGCGSAT
jgi:hypothetical protein